jgi:integrase
VDAEVRVNARRRTVNANLPDRMIRVQVRRPRRVYTYYYFDAGTAAESRYVALGPDYVAALRKYVELAGGNASVAALATFSDVARRYQAEVIPSKAPRTQRDYVVFLQRLLAVFGDAPLADVEPVHVRQYLDRRRASPIRANREVALFSAIWNFARQIGATDRANPVAGVSKFLERPRGVYIDSRQREAILAVAPAPLADAIELAYLTGQRPSDVLRMRESDIRDGCLEVEQAKTKAKLRIEVTGRLAEVLERIRQRKREHRVVDTALVVGVNGRAISQHYIRSLWVRARDAAGLDKSLQFRDLRAAAASDVDEARSIRDAQSLLGHSTVRMTEAYARSRRGKKVRPVK